MSWDFNELVGAKALVTGATGFSGGHLTRRLLGLGVETTVLVRASSDKQLVDGLVDKGAKVIVGDVTDVASVDKATEGQDYVFHLAALFREAKFPDSAYTEVNVDGTQNVIGACCRFGVRRLIHCSTNGVHGTIENPPGNEESPFNPGDPYQVSKLEAEYAVKRAVEAGQVDAVIIRPAMIWGEGDKRFLKLFKGVAKRRFPIIGDGKTWMHFLHIEDLVNGFLLAADNLNASGQVYLLAGRKAVPLSYVVETIAKLAGVEPLPFKLPGMPVLLVADLMEAVCKPFKIEPPLHRRRVNFFFKHRNFNISKAKRELGYEPMRSFEEEARMIYNWYREFGWM